MRWISTVTLVFALAGGVLAAGPDEDYYAIYIQIQQADVLLKGGQTPLAVTRYSQANDALQKYHTEHPGANLAAVNYRFAYLADKLNELKGSAASANAGSASGSEKPFSALTPQQQAAASLQELTNAYARLYLKYKEATSVQPAAVAPDELAKAQAKIKDLEKEMELLKATLDQRKPAAPAAATETNKSAQTEISRLNLALAESQRKLDDTTAELNNLKVRPPVERPVADNLQQITAERDQAKKDLAAVSKQLADLEAHAAVSPVAPVADAAKPQVPVPVMPENLTVAPAADAAKPQEAGKAPSAVTELAATAASPAAPLPAPPVAAREPSAKVHSARDLSAAAAAIMREADLDIRAQHYDDAEKKYVQVLQQDENNIYVLAFLGNAEFAAGHLDDCEKNVRRALDLAPNDGGSLYLLGMLRYRQEKLDDALEAFSRSAAINPTNASTQNYLGCILADKGMHSQAEAALRRALELKPDYADAHFNLAFVYARETPPSPAMARSEYGKAVELGHEKSADLEKMLSGAK